MSDSQYKWPLVVLLLVYKNEHLSFCSSGWATSFPLSRHVTSQFLCSPSPSSGEKVNWLEKIVLKSTLVFFFSSMKHKSMFKCAKCHSSND